MGSDRSPTKMGTGMTEPLEAPRLWTRLAARLHGEVPAEQLEAFRRAGGPVYETYLSAENALTGMSGLGKHPWEAEAGTKSQLLCTWNAFLLQTLAAALLDADYAAMPSTVGYLPPVTAEQAWALFEQVEPWLSRARQAAHGTSYDVAAELTLPADLPPWVEVEPCPRAHLDAMLAATATAHEHLDALLGGLLGAGDPPKQYVTALERVQRLGVDAHTASSYAAGLAHPGADTALHEVIEEHLHRALELQYHLGQLIADPDLLDGYVGPGGQGAPAPTGRPLAEPGQQGFDPWCLTSPRTRTHWQNDPQARRAIDSLWKYDPDPARTVGLAAQIAAAFEAGDIAYATDERGREFGNYFCCPWSAIYVVKRPVRLAGKRLRVMEQFALDVSAEEMAETGTFVRQLVTGPFSTTDKIDYCDPEAGGHDDD